MPAKPVRNLKLEIEYDGTPFSGWQVQNSAQPRRGKTIQEILEKTLRQILREDVKIAGSGRTDAGVHALNQVANFKTQAKKPCAAIQKALNSLLPKEISVTKISEVPDSFHARFSAKSKAYRYFIQNSKFPSAFRYKFSWHIPYKLNTGLMRQEAKALLGRYDFKSFCASASGAKTTIRIIKKLSIKTVKPNMIYIDIEADGFLYNMARNIVGTLVEIGRGKLEKGALKRILRAKDRRQAGPTAPARGLFLVKVNY